MSSGPLPIAFFTSGVCPIRHFVKCFSQSSLRQLSDM